MGGLEQQDRGCGAGNSTVLLVMVLIGSGQRENLTKGAVKVWSAVGFRI